MAHAPNSLRLACLDLTRICEQTAVLSMLLSGRQREGQSHTLRAKLLRTFLPALDNAASAAVRIADFDPLSAGCSEQANGRVRLPNGPECRWLGSYLQRPTLGRPPAGGSPASWPPTHADRDWPPIEIIVKVVSGWPDLINGAFGAMAILGGAVAVPDAPYRPPFPLARRNPLDPDQRLQRYLVLCSRHRALIDAARDELTAAAPEATERPLPEARALQQLAERVFRRTLLATVLDDEHALMRKLVKGSLYRQLSGSPVGAAIVTLEPRYDLDLFVGVVRHATAQLIAIAVEGHGGHALFVPLASGKTRPVFPAGRPEVWAAPKFVDTPHTFLIATGITPHPLLPGVTFGRDAAGACGVDLVRPRLRSTVRTQTYVLNGTSKTQRMVRHTRDLSTDSFYGVGADGDTLKPAHEVLESFLDELDRDRAAEGGAGDPAAGDP